MTAVPLLVSVPTTALLDALGEAPPGLRPLVWDMLVDAPFEHIDIVVPPYMGSLSLLARLASVTTQLVQSQSVGYDGVSDALPPGHVFANAATVHETATAELTLALVLASQRGLPDVVRHADLGQWRSAWQPGLADRAVLLIGAGGVGSAIEARLRPFEVAVTRVARTARSDERGSVHAARELPDLLPRADVVIVAVPLSEATVHLIDDDFLSRVRDGALVVNVSRGAVADTAALVTHASSGRVRLALDVTDPEPLPADHPLWTLPGVLISPHVGGMTSAMLPRMARLLRLQIDRLACGDAPVNVVLTS
ncbi:MAG: 2-hydroxyacid dehydrogenase [Acidimicrobiales bacterium]